MKLDELKQFDMQFFAEGDPPADSPQDPPADPPKDDPSADPPGGDPPKDPPKLDLDAALKELERARKEAAKYRTEKNEKDGKVKDLEKQFEAMKKGLAKLVGLEKDEPNPEELTGKINELTAKYRQERLQNRFNKIAGKNEADADLTWAYLFANGKLNDLDVEADDFETKLVERVQEALEANPKLKATPQKPGVGAGTNPGENTGNEPTVITKETLKTKGPEWINEHWEEIQELMAQGKI